MVNGPSNLLDSFLVRPSVTGRFRPSSQTSSPSLYFGPGCRCLLANSSCEACASVICSCRISSILLILSANSSAALRSSVPTGSVGSPKWPAGSNPIRGCWPELAKKGLTPVVSET